MPDHVDDRRNQGAAPVALARAWIEDRGLDIAALSFVVAPLAIEAMSIWRDDLLLIDGRPLGKIEGQFCAFAFRHQVGVSGVTGCRQVFSSRSGSGDRRGI